MGLSPLESQTKSWEQDYVEWVKGVLNRFPQCALVKLIFLINLLWSFNIYRRVPLDSTYKCIISLETFVFFQRLASTTAIFLFTHLLLLHAITIWLRCCSIQAFAPCNQNPSPLVQHPIVLVSQIVQPKLAIVEYHPSS